MVPEISRLARAGLSALLALAASLPAATAAAMPGYDAQFEQIRVPALRAGSDHDVWAVVWNRGTATWSSDVATDPVFVSYHWLDGTGSVVIWDGLRTRLPSPLRGSDVRSLPLRVRAPAAPGVYVLVLQMVREGVEWFGAAQSLGAQTVRLETYVASIATTALSSGAPGERATMPVKVQNNGSATWHAAGPAPVRLSYHWLDTGDRVLVWDGERTVLPSDIAPGEQRDVLVFVVLPPRTGRYVIAIEPVMEGVAWFSALGSGRSTLLVGVPTGYATALLDGPAPSIVVGATRSTTVTLRIRNVGQRTWRADGTNPTRLSYHLREPLSGLVVWDGPRTALPRDVAPGEEVTLATELRIPDGMWSGYVTFDLVVEGLAWLSDVNPKGALAISGFSVTP